MQPHEGIEHEQSRRIRGDGVAEAALIVLPIESERGGGDEVDGERGELETAVATDAGEARLDDGGRIFGHIYEHAPHIAYLEDAEARRTARDGERDLEGEPRLAALRRAAEDTDAGARPEGLDEPSRAHLGVVDVRRAHDGQSVVAVAVHGALPSSATAASKTCSSRKAWFFSWAIRIATRRTFAATRRTPRLARKSSEVDPIVRTKSRAT